jgi:lipopolysaccharide biosynthesis glycosyltransferase
MHRKLDSKEKAENLERDEINFRFSARQLNHEYLQSADKKINNVLRESRVEFLQSKYNFMTQVETPHPQ